ncbi:heavy-metal-associated domain-containing protein [Rufibacter latericius]|uniref:Copper chaperone n=1 Tax=Rufibacter latericius TaxID=2487040 RepID=A0A3M9MKU2_9BACT|nr:heavy-metal-associated domain-containing protein [Rufibacter latericius]RNI26154.1 copper chaperone [Rufibacter latericius]
MSTKRFKTNIKCGNCVSAVTPSLENTPGIYTWQVDTATPDRILTVEGDATSEAVILAVELAGYEATEIKE